MKSCASCIFWDQRTPGAVQEKSVGYCHRYPPVSKVVSYPNKGLVAETSHPQPTADDWCGEYVDADYQDAQ